MRPSTAEPLSTLRTGQSARVVGLDTGTAPTSSHRLADLGFLPGTEVVCLRRAPLGSPVVYCVADTQLCLRHDLAACVLVDQVR